MLDKIVLLTTTAEIDSVDSMWMMGAQLVGLALMFVVFYFLIIRPQRKKEKEDKTMRESIQIGDEVTTVGGIVGLVVSMKHDTVVIETGSERNKIRIKRWAISDNATKHDVEGKV